MDRKKILWGILLFNILYVIFFGFHFYSIGNYEFVWYVFIMIILIALIIFLNKKYDFTIPTLIGLSIWGIGHMLGGSTLLTTERLYVQVLYPLFVTEDVTVLSYDHLMHFYFYVVATAVIYQILRVYMKIDAQWLPIAAFIALASIGVGAFNELVEFLPVLFLHDTGVGGYFNIAWDLVFNALGATVTIVYLTIKRRMPSVRTL